MSPAGELSINLKTDTQGTTYKTVWTSETSSKTANANVLRINNKVLEIYDTINKVQVKSYKTASGSGLYFVM